MLASLKRLWQNPLTAYYLALVILIILAWFARGFLSLALFTIIFIYLGNAAIGGLERRLPLPHGADDVTGLPSLFGHLGRGLCPDHPATGQRGLEPAPHGGTPDSDLPATRKLRQEADDQSIAECVRRQQW